MTPGTTLGYRRFIEAHRRGEDLVKLLNDLLATRHQGGGAEVLSGALSALMASYDALVAAGCRIHCANDDRVDALLAGPPTARAVALSLALNAADGAAASQLLSGIVQAVQALRGYVDWRDAPDPQPLAVRVVGMPDRITRTRIERDDAGRIATTQHIEFDALAGAK